MAKKHCAGRAEWRLQPGNPPKRLPTHYRLDCDHGSAIFLCWQTGGSEPIYLCEAHAQECKSPNESRPEARPNARSATIAAATAEHSPSGIHFPGLTQAPPPTQPEPALATAPVPAAEQINEANPGAGRKTSLAPAAPTEPIAGTVASLGPRADEELSSPGQSAAVPNSIPSRAVQPLDAPTLESKPRRALHETPLRSIGMTRDLVFGNPAKAMVDEAIWNLLTGDCEAYRAALQQGKTAAEAAQAAGGQFAAVHRKISDYTTRLDSMFSASKAAINVSDAIDKPLEQAMLEIIELDALTDSEKDAAIQQLVTLQEWAKQDLPANAAPADANRILLAIGDRLNWGAHNPIPERLKPGHRTLFSTLKSALHAAVPEAQELHERLINLYAAKSDLLGLNVPELIAR